MRINAALSMHGNAEMDGSFCKRRVGEPLFFSRSLSLSLPPHSLSLCGTVLERAFERSKSLSHK